MGKDLILGNNIFNTFKTCFPSNLFIAISESKFYIFLSFSFAIASSLLILFKLFFPNKCTYHHYLPHCIKMKSVSKKCTLVIDYLIFLILLFVQIDLLIKFKT